MTIKIGINGFGRIGRNVMRALYESGYRHRMEIVAVNDTTDIPTNAHLIKHDTTHGKFPHVVETREDGLVIDGDFVRFFSDRDPTKIPWGACDVDIVFECTGVFATREKASMHLQAGAKKVLISAPGDKTMPTIVYGVNHNILKPTDFIVSNASCTTNCLAPVAKILHHHYGIKSGFMTTVHAYTNDQNLIDVAHKDLRRARAATQSMIPTKTGAAAAVGLVLPELNGKLDGYAVRVPVINVSMVDLTIDVEKMATPQEINAVLKAAAEEEMRGIMAYTNEPLVSADFNHTSVSATIDALETRVIGNLMKVVAWYDNEWGFSNRMLDTASVMMQ